MTVETTTRKQQFTIATATADYDFTFRALTAAPTDIKATVTTSGTDTALVYTTDYTVAVNSDGVGGTVTLVAPEDYDSATLTVYRETTDKQESDYDDYNQFPADTLETDLDKRTMLSQEKDEDLDRSIKFAITSTTSDIDFPEPVANEFIAWNAAADGLITTAGTGSTGATGATGPKGDTGDIGDPTVTVVTSGSTIGMSITNSGTGTSFVVTQSAAAIGILSDNAGALNAIRIDQSGVLTASTGALQIYSNAEQTITGSSALRIQYANTNSTEKMVEFINHGTGKALYVDQVGVSAANNAALHVYSNVVQNAEELVHFQMDQLTSDQNVLLITNDGTGHALNISQTQAAGAGFGINVANAGTGKGLMIDQSGTLASANPALHVYSNVTQANAELLKVEQDHSSSSAQVASISNDGSGNALIITQTGNLASSKFALHVDNNGSPSDGAGAALAFDGCSVANSTSTVTISNVAPDAVGTATISRWLVVSMEGTLYYIPAWT